jgi:hypothetical protein
MAITAAVLTFSFSSAATAAALPKSVAVSSSTSNVRQLAKLGPHKARFVAVQTGAFAASVRTAPANWGAYFQCILGFGVPLALAFNLANSYYLKAIQYSGAWNACKRFVNS